MEHNLLLPSWELTYPLPAGTFEDDASYLDPQKMYLWIKFPGGFLDPGFSDPVMKLVFCFGYTDLEVPPQNSKDEALVWLSK